MWICTSDAFVSVVDKAKTPGCLVVRARVPGHIEAIFPDAEVIRTTGNDYLFRAEIKRVEVAKAMQRAVMEIDYDNFKNSITSEPLHKAAYGVWNCLARMQNPPPYSREVGGDLFEGGDVLAS